MLFAHLAGVNGPSAIKKKVKIIGAFHRVAFHKTKTVCFLIITALVCSSPVICPAQTNTQEDESQSSDDSKFIVAQDPNFTFSSPGGFKDKELVYKFVFSVFLVVAVGTAAVYFSKRLGGKIKRFSGKKIQVVETIYLGQRKALHLLKVGRREILIASTNENINMIADVSETFSDLTGFVDDSEKEE
ncbi:MAG: FliO/MopB family protein [Planctomycetota bacterium]|jgi:flagellar biogenesis protein FliO